MRMSTRFASIALGVAVAAAAPALAKECYAPDARGQERAFSRAISTEGGKTLWLGGQAGAPTLDFEGQVRAIFDALNKTIKANGGSGSEGSGDHDGCLSRIPGQAHSNPQRDLQGMLPRKCSDSRQRTGRPRPSG
jgi:hypothetical protein